MSSLSETINGLPECKTWQERFAILLKLVETWYEKSTSEDRITEYELAGKAIPVPLLEWYRHYGKRNGILDGHHQLIRPDSISNWDEDIYWQFYTEHQSVYFWGLKKNQDIRYINDPEVYGRWSGSNTPWVSQNVTLTEFLIQACIFEYLTHAPYGISMSFSEEEKLQKITSRFHELPLAPWHWPMYPSRFFYRDSVVCNVSDDEHSRSHRFSVVIGAKTSNALNFLRPFSEKEWCYWTPNYC